MRGSRILRRLAYRLTRNASYCSRLFEQYQIEMFVSLLSDKTPIHRPNMQQDGHLKFPPISEFLSFLPPSVLSSRSMCPTSDTHFLVTVISVDGQYKASFFGTRSQLLD